MAYNYDDYIKPITETLYDPNWLGNAGEVNPGYQQTTYTNPNGPTDIDINGLQYQLYGNKLTRSDNNRVYQYDAIRNPDGTLGWNNYSESEDQPDWYKEPTAQAGMLMIGGAIAAGAGAAGAGAGSAGSSGSAFMNPAAWTGAGSAPTAFGGAEAAGLGGTMSMSGGASGGGFGGTSAVNELGIPLEDVGNWTDADWTKWAGNADMSGSPAQLSSADLWGYGDGASGNMAGSWGDSQTFNQGNWNQDQYKAWADANASGTSMTSPTQLTRADLAGFGDAASGTAGSYGLRDLWNDFNTGARTFGSTARDLNSLGGNNNGGLAGLWAAKIQADQQERMAQRYYDMTAPYRQDATKYGDMIRETYTDPSKYLNSPEYQAVARTNLDMLQRQDAAGGRLANDIGRQAKMQDFAYEHLDNYRKGLASMYNNMAGIGTGQGTQTAIALEGTKNSPYARWLGGYQ